MSSASDCMPNFTGSIIADRYKLSEVLGSGTYGVVYKAIDTRTTPEPDSDAHYRAIKIIRKLGRQPLEIAAIRREVALHSVVSHKPNIVTIHDAIDDDDYFYLVLDFCDGGDLFDHICSNGTYNNNDTLVKTAFLTLIDAVQVCHDNQIAHRDLKPENILASADGSKLYLADFGLATDERLCEDFGRGTNIYMAPECYGNTRKPYCTHASDIWALGVILFNMITTRNPWSKATLKDHGFWTFLDNPRVLYNETSISPAAFDIIVRIFDVMPLERITLPELRKAISSIDSFWRDPWTKSLDDRPTTTATSIDVKYRATDSPKSTLSLSSPSMTSLCFRAWSSGSEAEAEFPTAWKFADEKVRVSEAPEMPNSIAFSDFV